MLLKKNKTQDCIRPIVILIKKKLFLTFKNTCGGCGERLHMYAAFSVGRPVLHVDKFWNLNARPYGSY